MKPTTPINEAFTETQYTVRQKFFKILGSAFHIYDKNGDCKFYSKQKFLKLKEDLRIYSDETESEELLVIRARNIIDLGATYDVIDPNRDNEAVGALRRKAIKSFFIDEWCVLDSSGKEIGLIKEDSLILAILRRYLLGWLVPQTYVGYVRESPVCTFKRNFNPFVSKIQIDFGMDQSGNLDCRLGLSAAILLVAIEKKHT